MSGQCVIHTESAEWPMMLLVIHLLPPPSHFGQQSQVDLKRDDDCEAKQGSKQLTSNRSDNEINPAG